MAERASCLERWRLLPGGFVSLSRLAKESGLDVATAWRAQHRKGSITTFERIADATWRLRPGAGLTVGQILGTEPYEAEEALPTAQAAQV